MKGEEYNFQTLNSWRKISEFFKMADFVMKNPHFEQNQLILCSDLKAHQNMMQEVVNRFFVAQMLCSSTKVFKKVVIYWVHSNHFFNHFCRWAQQKGSWDIRQKRWLHKQLDSFFCEFLYITKLMLTWFDVAEKPFDILNVCSHL